MAVMQNFIAKISPKVYIRTFGCQMNEYDSGVVEDMLARDGYEVCYEGDGADVVIVNTCSVRQHAEDRACGYLREIARVKKERKLKEEKDITLVVMGCMAQREGDKFFEIIPELDIICGVDSFRELPAMLEKSRVEKPAIEGFGQDSSIMGESAKEERKREVGERKARRVDISRKDGFDGDEKNCSVSRNSLKGYVTVMRGCNNWCSYCVVPGARGKEKSRDIADIVDEVKRLVDRGVKEVTLLGQNIHAYGKNNSPAPGAVQGLITVLEQVNKIAGLLRIRFITSHPRDIEPELFQAMGEMEKVMEYLHLPLQAGSDRILKLMNRGYTLSHYIGVVEKMRNVLPEASLGTDLIAGFPGESEEEFNETLRAVEEIGFDMAYMYKYSPRPGTKAFNMEGQVDKEVIEERHQKLLKLQEKISLKNNQDFIGKEVEVLVEGRSRRNPGRLCGRDRGNRMVVFEGSDELIGNVVHVKIKDATSLTLYGEKK